MPRIRVASPNFPGKKSSVIINQVRDGKEGLAQGVYIYIYIYIFFFFFFAGGKRGWGGGGYERYGREKWVSCLQNYLTSEDV